MVAAVLVSTYHCIACDVVQRVTVSKEKHEVTVNASPNGLISYSDIHYCYDGILGINNLQIDKNMAVRSFSLIEFPSMKKMRQPKTGIPVPMAPKPVKNIYHVDGIDNSKSMKLIIKDKGLNTELYIGDFSAEEEAIVHLKSKLGSVNLELYKCDTKPTFAMKQWLRVLIDTVEKVPPTKLGLLIEALRFVMENRKTRPGMFEIDQLYALLTTHKIKIKSVSIHTVSSLRGKYGDVFADKVWLIFKYLAKNKKREVILQELMEVVDKDLRFITFAAFILENEGMISLIRPEIDD